MKKLFSNPTFLHIFYGSMVALLSLYYFIARPSNDFTSITKTLRMSTEIVHETMSNTKVDLDTEVKAYRNASSVHVQEIADSVITQSDSVINQIETINEEFYREIENSNSFLLKTSIPTRLFFSEKKILMLTQLVDKYKHNVGQKIEDPRDREMLLKLWNKDLHFNVGQNDFKSLLPNQARLHLFQQIANIRQFEFSIINYYRSKVGGCFKIENFMIDISPNTGAVKVGEKFSADIVLASFFSHFEPNEVAFWVDGKPLEVKNGIANFTEKYNTPGKQTIKAAGSIKNSLTGEVKTYTKEFTFVVLPK